MWTGSRICAQARGRPSVQMRSRQGEEEELIVVVGAGAAGLTAAYFAAQARARVVVLERMKEAGVLHLVPGLKYGANSPLHLCHHNSSFGSACQGSHP